jgi:plasmid stability protein
MASLIVRRLDDDLVRRLKARAATHGRAAEAEHRAVLESALRPKVTGRALWAKLSKGAETELDLDAGVVHAVESADFE